MPAAIVSPSSVNRVFSKNPIVAFYQSSIGKKITVAVSGVILMLFILGHLAGNLEIFLGQDHMNAYSTFLHSTGPLLWIIRIILLATVLIHITATIQLTVANRKAKPKKYAIPGHQRSTTASRTMIWGGLMVLAFIIWHLMQFTFEATDARFHALKDSLGRHDVYSMVILGFQNPINALFYAVALFCLGMHLSHGFMSVTQTLGINNRKVSENITRWGRVIAWLIFIGYVSIPASVLLGILKPLQ
jgi:succinate dehydrogenase / fumarate reductase, cytochrome b subunit